MSPRLVPPDFPPGLARLVLLLMAAAQDSLERLDGACVPRHEGLPEYRDQLREAGMSANGPQFAKVIPRAAGSWLTADEAADLMGVSPRQVRRLAQEGQIIAQRHGRAWLIDRYAAEDYQRRR